MQARDVSNTTTTEKSLIDVKVGNKTFSFYKQNIELYAKDSVLDKASSGNYKQEPLYLDIDEKLFKQWVCPYLRHGLLPTVENISDTYQRMHLLAMVNTLGLHDFSRHLESEKKVSITFSMSGADLVSFNDKFVSYQDAMKCPDASCNATLTQKAHIEDGKVINHFFSEPHYGKVTFFESSILSQQSGGLHIYKDGKIECFMKSYTK